MSQTDYNIANASGSAVRADLNAVFGAIQSNNSDADAPAAADSVAYQWWADTDEAKPVSGTGVMRIRDTSTDTLWHKLFALDGSSLPSFTATELCFNEAGADLDFRIEGDTEANLFFIDAGNDRVGIGNNAPASTLDVTGAITSKTSTAGLSDQSITFTESGSGNAYGVRLGHASNTEFAFERYDGGWTETVRIDGAGNVGIGADPSSKLHLSAASGSVQMQINSGGNSTYIGHDSGFTGLDFAAGGGIRFRYHTGAAYATSATIDSNGNFGIGETSPARNLVVANPSGTPWISVLNSAGDDGGILFGTSANDALGQIRYQTSNNTLLFKVNSAERARINSAGFLKASNSATYVGATSSYHEIANSISGQDTIRITGRASSNPYGAIIEFPLTSPDNNSNYFLNCNDSTTTRLIIYSDGDVKNHDNSYGALSDEKLKQNIADAGSQWDDLKNLRVRKFKFKSDVEAYGDNAKTLIGLVAQEVETVSPGLVKESPDMDAENNDLGTTTKSVSYSVLYMKAVKALQEAMERIETLEAKVAALESA